MRVLVITNNWQVKEKLEKLETAVLYQENPVRTTLLYARDQVIQGWHLAADPRGGYNKRFNPYHTVFLCDEAVNNTGEDVWILEEAAAFSHSPYQVEAEYTVSELRDFQILDTAIAERTYERLKMYMDKESESFFREEDTYG